jgi:hypothetical protein
VLRVRPSGIVEVEGLTQRPTPAPLRLLARDLPVDHPTWVWLRSVGVTRPTPSGTNIPREQRRTQHARVELALAPEVADRLRAAAERAGMSVSAYVAGLV